MIMSFVLYVCIIICDQTVGYSANSYEYHVIEGYVTFISYHFRSLVLPASLTTLDVRKSQIT
jgi:hypothetical protein